MAGVDYRGSFLWYDLMTTDPDAAAAFYTRVIGWGTAPYEIPGLPPYTMWMAGERPIGGVTPLPDEAKAAGAQPYWLASIGTPDVDAAVAVVERLGGKVLALPADIPTVGRFALIADPQGASFALLRPEGDWASVESSGVGHVSWHELATSDYRAAFAFYAELFGWVETSSMDMGELGTYFMFGRSGGPPLGGFYNMAPHQPCPAWLYYTTVDDVDRVAEDARRNGGQVIVEPMEVPGGDRIVVCVDPQGAPFGAHQRKA